MGVLLYLKICDIRVRDIKSGLFEVAIKRDVLCLNGLG